MREALKDYEHTVHTGGLVEVSRQLALVASAESNTGRLALTDVSRSENMQEAPVFNEGGLNGSSESSL